MERRFKDDGEEIGRLSEDAGKTEGGWREKEAEDKEWGKAGWLHRLTAWMVKAGHKFPQTIRSAGPWCMGVGWGHRPLRRGQPHGGCAFDKSSPMNTLFIQAFSISC